MIKKSSIILVSSSEFFAKAISWLCLALIPFFAKPEIYGEIVLYYSIILFFIPIYLFGQDRLILKNEPEIEVKNSLYFSFFILLITLIFLFLLDFILVGFAGFFLALNKILLTYLRAKDSFKEYSINRFFYSILRFFLVGIIVVYFYSLNNYLLSEIFSALILSFGLIYIVFKNKEPACVNYYLRFKHGLPLMLHGVSLFAIALIDRFFLEAYTDLYTVGNYSFIYIFASGLVFLYSIVGILMEKKIYKSINDVELILNIKKTVSYMVFVGCLGSILSYTIYYFLINLNILKGYSYLPFELFLLLIAHIIIPIYLVSNYFLIQRGRSDLLLYSTFFSFIINLLMNILFIPKLGLIGAVYATLLSNVILCATISFLSYKVFKFSNESH